MKLKYQTKTRLNELSEVTLSLCDSDTLAFCKFILKFFKMTTQF